MSSFLSDSDSGDDIKVVWRTGPTQKFASRPEASTSSRPHALNATPESKMKRSSKQASLRSPSAAGSSGEPPQRDTKKKKKKIKKPNRDSAGVVKSDIPMDQTTLQLVSQLAMKVQARCNPGHATSTTVTMGNGLGPFPSDQAGLGIMNRSRVAKGSPLLPKPNRSQGEPKSIPLGRKLGFSATKPSLPSPSAKPSIGHKPLSNEPTSAPRGFLAALAPDEAEEEEDFDSYFDDFGDESFELALSQLDSFETPRDDLAPGPVPVGTVGSLEGIEEKRRRTEELAKREVDGLAGLTDWGSDDDF